MPNWVQLSFLQIVLMVFIVPAIIFAGVLAYGPDLVRDYRLAATYKPAHDLRATDGECTSYAFILTTCSATVTSLRPGVPERSVGFAMFFQSAAGERMIPVRSSVDQSAVTIRPAVNAVTARGLSLIGGILAFGALWFMFFGFFRRGRYNGGAAHQALQQFVEANAQAATQARSRTQAV